MNEPTVKQMECALAAHLHPRIPLDAYLNGLHSPRSRGPIEDFDARGWHEINGRNSKTGNPTVVELD